jgi:hypothetical protein
MSHKMNDTTTLTIRHGHDREIKAEVIALNDDIAGQPTRVSVRVQKTMAWPVLSPLAFGCGSRRV